MLRAARTTMMLLVAGSALALLAGCLGSASNKAGGRATPTPLKLTLAN